MEEWLHARTDQTCLDDNVRNTKSLNENLAPLVRFLRSSCGRPWNDVYSEIRERISPKSAVQLHIWQHVEQYVQRNLQVTADGQLAHPQFAWPRGGPFYVDPRTGLLCEDRTWRRYRRPPPEPVAYIRLKDEPVGPASKGIWYAVQTAVARDSAGSSRRDSAKTGGQPQLTDRMPTLRRALLRCAAGS